jgi:hypothetical protein
MRPTGIKTVLLLLVLLVSPCSEAPSKVYSVAVYAGGTSYLELCSFPFPFHYKLTERSRYENTNGFIIIALGQEKERGGGLRRYLDVECGSASFSVPLDSVPPKQ